MDSLHTIFLINLEQWKGIGCQRMPVWNWRCCLFTLFPLVTDPFLLLLIYQKYWVQRVFIFVSNPYMLHCCKLFSLHHRFMHSIMFMRDGEYVQALLCFCYKRVVWQIGFQSRQQIWYIQVIYMNLWCRENNLQQCNMYRFDTKIKTRCT